MYFMWDIPALPHELDERLGSWPVAVHPRATLRRVRSLVAWCTASRMAQMSKLVNNACGSRPTVIGILGVVSFLLIISISSSHSPSGCLRRASSRVAKVDIESPDRDIRKSRSKCSRSSDMRCPCNSWGGYAGCLIPALTLLSFIPQNRQRLLCWPNTLVSLILYASF